MNLVLDFTEEEANALTQLCDIALRANGLGALDVATHFKAKLSAARLVASATAPKSTEVAIPSNTAE